LNYDGLVILGTFSLPERITHYFNDVFTGNGFAISINTIITGGTIIPEGQNIDLSLLDSDQKVPLFDANGLGTVRVKMTKNKRSLFRNTLIRGVVGVVASDGIHYGFIDYIKEVDLNNNVAELRFLKSFTVPEPPLPPDGYILNEDGTVIQTEDGFGFLLEQD
jgi:hypothetical protein